MAVELEAYLQLGVGEVEVEVEGQLVLEEVVGVEG